MARRGRQVGALHPLRAIRALGPDVGAPPLRHRGPVGRGASTLRAGSCRRALRVAPDWGVCARGFLAFQVARWGALDAARLMQAGSAVRDSLSSGPMRKVPVALVLVIMRALGSTSTC